VRGSDQGGDVGDIELRVGRRFDPEQRRTVEGGDDGGGVGDVHEAGLPAASGRVGKESAGATEAI